MKGFEDAGPALTLAECARELGLKSESALKAAIKAGRLVVLVLSGKADMSLPGPKLYRVERAEWERFKASIRTRGENPLPVEPPPERSRRGRPKKGAPARTGLLGDWES